MCPEIASRNLLQNSQLMDIQITRDIPAEDAKTIIEKIKSLCLAVNISCQVHDEEDDFKLEYLPGSVNITELSDTKPDVVVTYADQQDSSKLQKKLTNIIDIIQKKKDEKLNEHKIKLQNLSKKLTRMKLLNQAELLRNLHDFIEKRPALETEQIPTLEEVYQKFNKSQVDRKKREIEKKSREQLNEIKKNTIIIYLTMVFFQRLMSY